MQKLDFSPYAYVRTRVMKSLLLGRNDYLSIMKMNVSEITSYLQSLEYREDVNALGTSFSGIDLMEMALSRNLSRNCSKLRRICPDDLRQILDPYLQRYDLMNIKTVLRGIIAKRDVENLMLDTGVFPLDFYRELAKCDFDEALKKLNNKPFPTTGMKSKNLAEIENRLDQMYYKQLLALADDVPKQGKLFKDFLLKEIETLNILTFLRLKREDVSDDKISEFIIGNEAESKGASKAIYKNKSSSKFFESIINSKTLESALSKIKQKISLKAGLEEYENTGSLMKLERLLMKDLLGQALLMFHRKIISINSILGYVFAKEIEIRNLRILIKGKSFGLDDELIEEEIII